MNLKQYIEYTPFWQGWSDEDYELHYQDTIAEKEKKTIAKRNKTQAEALRDVAWKLYKIGFYSLDDYNQFCFKNNIPIF